MLVEHYREFYGRVFHDAILQEQSLSAPMSVDLAQLYVPIRCSVGLHPWDAEEAFLRELTNWGGQLLLIGEAGSGKTTFLNGFFRLYRFYRNSLLHGRAVGGGLAESAISGSAKEVSAFDLNSWRQFIDSLANVSPIDTVHADVFHVSLLSYNSVTTLETLHDDVFIQLREQLLDRYRGIDSECEYYMFDTTRPDTKGTDGSVQPGKRVASLELLGKEQQEHRVISKAQSFCKLAFDYLTRRKFPRDSTRRRIILVLDDSDRVAPDIACLLQERIVATVFPHQIEGTLLPVMIMSLRPETYRLRHPYHVAQGPVAEKFFELPRVAHRPVTALRAATLSDIVCIDRRTVSEKIVPPGSNGHFVYWIPIASAIGHKYMKSVCDLSREVSRLQGESSGLPDTFRDVIDPLCEFSIRRRLWFQKAMARSKVLEFRVLKGLNVSRRHLALACYSGESGTAKELDGYESVGCWYARLHESFNEILSINAVLSGLYGLCTEGDKILPRDGVFVISERRLLNLLKSIRMHQAICKNVLGRLIKFGFVDRPVIPLDYAGRPLESDLRFCVRKETIRALQCLLTDPFYLEVVSVYLLDQNFPFWKETDSFVADMKKRNENILLLVNSLVQAEVEWINALSSVDEPERLSKIFASLNELQVQRLGSAVIRSLLVNCEFMLKIEASAVLPGKDVENSRQTVGFSEEAREVVRDMREKLMDVCRRFPHVQLMSGLKHWDMEQLLPKLT